MDAPVRMILRWLLFPLFLLIFLYFIATGFSVFVMTNGGGSAQLVAIADRVRSDLGESTFEVWRFVRPLLQLGIILLIIYSFVRALGIDLGLRASSQDVSIQTLLAFLVVGGFALAALLSSEPAGWLKDLALVVVGFYFGTRAKDPERDGPYGRSRSPTPLTPPTPTSDEPARAPQFSEDSAEESRARTQSDTGSGESLRSNARRWDRAEAPDLAQKGPNEAPDFRRA